MRRLERSLLASMTAAGISAALVSCEEDRFVAPTGGAHPASFVDPRSAEHHGKFLRQRRYAPMLEPNDPDTCGRCHDGAPRPSSVHFPAPGAPSCATCHQEEDGPRACATCHGREPGAHRAHDGLACSTCHPTPTAPGDFSGAHGSAHVDVVFDAVVAGPRAAYRRDTGACAVRCHEQGGSRSRPAWNEAEPMKCGDCHASSPPANHYPGPCSGCHRELDAVGATFNNPVLHVNGRVDVGDGSGKCGACHGEGDDPWPATAAHRRHRDPTQAATVSCGDCHVVPQTIDAPGHLDGVVQIVFSERARARSARPSWDGSACKNVACHGAGLADVPVVVPVWKDTSHAASTCGACHGLPPSQHTASTSCERSSCHGGEVERLGTTLKISDAGRSLHVNGVRDAVR